MRYTPRVRRSCSGEGAWFASSRSIAASAPSASPPPSRAGAVEGAEASADKVTEESAGEISGEGVAGFVFGKTHTATKGRITKERKSDAKRPTPTGKPMWLR